MLQELVKNYRLEKEQLKAKGLKGEKLAELEIALTEEKYFKALDITELLDFLRDANYSTYSMSQIETTIDYMKRNDLFNDSRYEVILKDLFKCLETIKSRYYNLEEMDNLLERLTLLEKSINDHNSFVTDLPLIEQIIKESNISTTDIYKFVLEIDKHNKIVTENRKLEDTTKIQDLLSKYGYNAQLTDYEYDLLKQVEFQELEEKLEFLQSKNEYEFLKSPDKKRNLILILFAPLSNIQEVYRASLKNKLKLDNIFPIFYLNEGVTLPTPPLEDNYYKIITGNFESFIKNIKILADLGYNIEELYENFGVLFYVFPDIILNNVQTYTNYKIPIPIPSALAACDSSSDSVFSNIESQIDRFIEAGLYDYIKQFPQALLNKDRALFHRIYYAEKKSLPVKNKFLSRNITSVNGYSINEENYKEVVPLYTAPNFTTEFYQKVASSKPTMINEMVISDLIKVLDENFLESEFVYKIADTLISKNKVIRLFQSFLNQNNSNINYFEGLLFAILNGVLLDKEKYDLIILSVLEKFVNINNMTSEEAYNMAKALNVEESKITNLFSNNRGGK